MAHFIRLPTSPLLVSSASPLFCSPNAWQQLAMESMLRLLSSMESMARSLPHRSPTGSSVRLSLCSPVCMASTFQRKACCDRLIPWQAHTLVEGLTSPPLGSSVMLNLTQKCQARAAIRLLNNERVSGTVHLIACGSCLKTINAMEPPGAGHLLPLQLQVQLQRAGAGSPADKASSPSAAKSCHQARQQPTSG